MSEARPWRADAHLIETAFGTQLLVADGSRLFAVPEDLQETLDEAGRQGLDLAAVLAAHGVVLEPAIRAFEVEAPPLRALSLAVAQSCNLACTYCYAEGGSFGGEAKRMPETVALEAVARLLAEAAPGERVNLAFMGGEPLAARATLRATTEQAVRLAREQGVAIGFSLTTNGTLLDEEDAAFFARHGFAVTVSIDGVGEAHDRLRPFKDGRGSIDRVVERIRPLLARQGPMQVTARVTVTPDNLDLPATLDWLVGLGFHSVGFSPMLRSPSGKAELGPGDLDRMLAAMIACGERCLAATLQGRRYPFANLLTAWQEIHRGTHRPYPCGAGAGYMGVSAEGGLHACHRFVGDGAGAMGSLADGIDPARQRQWLDERHVDRQEPCGSCWARYLCGGGCHHEVLGRGRVACDYVRGWLDYCLKSYVELAERRPAFFGAG